MYPFPTSSQPFLRRKSVQNHLIATSLALNVDFDLINGLSLLRSEPLAAIAVWAVDSRAAHLCVGVDLHELDDAGPYSGIDIAHLLQEAVVQEDFNLFQAILADTVEDHLRFFVVWFA